MTDPDHPPVPEWWPVLGVGGFSGSGKTTLLERVIPVLVARGLRVAVIKHDAHGIVVDREGKDSDRLYKAGATVWLQGPEEGFARYRQPTPGLVELVRRALRGHDLVLIEGYKSEVGLPRVWLDHPTKGHPRAEGDDATILAWDSDRPAALIAAIDARLTATLPARRVIGGVLIGGASRRMGQPKHLLSWQGTTLIEHLVAQLDPVVDQVVAIGTGEVPATLASIMRLPDAHDPGRDPSRLGPLAGVLAGLRWCPEADWLILSCDMPAMTTDHLRWLLDARTPSSRSVAAIADGHTQPFPAVYGNRLLEPAELLWHAHRRSPRQLLLTPGAVHLPLPAGFADAWRNVNTPEDYDELVPSD